MFKCITTISIIILVGSGCSTSKIQKVNNSLTHERTMIQLDKCHPLFQNLEYYFQLCVKRPVRDCGSIKNHYKHPKTEFGKKPSTNDVNDAINDAFDKWAACFKS